MSNNKIQVKGNVTNATMVAGEGNVVGKNNQVESGGEVSLEALVGLLAELRSAVEALPVEPAQRDAALADLAMVETQSKAPEPNPGLIQSRLKLMTDTLSTIGGGAVGMDKVMALGTTVGGMIASLWS